MDLWTIRRWQTGPLAVEKSEDFSTARPFAHKLHSVVSRLNKTWSCLAHRRTEGMSKKGGSHGPTASECQEVIYTKVFTGKPEDPS